MILATLCNIFVLTSKVKKSGGLAALFSNHIFSLFLIHGEYERSEIEFKIVFKAKPRTIILELELHVV